jgi:hypothetical protein
MPELKASSFGDLLGNYFGGGCWGESYPLDSILSYLLIDFAPVNTCSFFCINFFSARLHRHT